MTNPEPAADPVLADQGWTREDELAYVRHCEAELREHHLEEQHGGRTRCERCDRFEVVHQTVSTGYDLSDFTRCRNCGHETFAG